MKKLREGLRGAPRRTQVQMAELLRVSSSAYQKWEERGNMRADFIMLFCELTHCSVSFYMTGRD